MYSCLQCKYPSSSAGSRGLVNSKWAWIYFLQEFNVILDIYSSLSWFASSEGFLHKFQRISPQSPQMRRPQITVQSSLDLLPWEFWSREILTYGDADITSATGIPQPVRAVCCFEVCWNARKSRSRSAIGCLGSFLGPWEEACQIINMP